MRLIDADEFESYLINRYGGNDTGDEIIEDLHNQPTITPDMAQVLAYECGKAERKRGKWIDEPIYKQTMDGKTWDGYTYCSECREMHEYGYRSNFCSSCGAEMLKGEEE
ncbi:MAG: hypothetical protein IJJ80_08665 [Clostridia bacterium]|nr:hypothetical protein [Clostridia bacterium]